MDAQGTEEVDDQRASRADPSEVADTGKGSKAKQGPLANGSPKAHEASVGAFGHDTATLQSKLPSADDEADTHHRQKGERTATSEQPQHEAGEGVPVQAEEALDEVDLGQSVAKDEQSEPALASEADPLKKAALLPEAEANGELPETQEQHLGTPGTKTPEAVKKAEEDSDPSQQPKAPAEGPEKDGKRRTAFGSVIPEPELSEHGSTNLAEQRSKEAEEIPDEKAEDEAANPPPRPSHRRTSSLEVHTIPIPTPEPREEGARDGAEPATEARPASDGPPVGSLGHGKPVPERTGVTASPPRSPKREAPAILPQSSDVLSSISSKPDATSVADDLAEAEARAEVAILAASQRNSSLGKKGSESASALEDDNAAFTEEALQGDDKEVVSAREDTPPARPFSPPPQASAPKAAGAFEPAEFRGLVFHDGVDAVGRPVIVVNAAAAGTKVSRKAACAYMLQRLEPIVVQGPYVLVLLNTGSARSNRLPAGWLASSYREMSYPFKKNVKHVILVRPSAALNFMLAIMRPLISKKAFVKLKKVDTLSAMAKATNLEVTLQHLGPTFAATVGQSVVAGENLSQSGYEMPTF